MTKVPPTTQPKRPSRLALGVTTAIALIILVLFISWITMLLLGAAHSYDERVPDLNFAATYLLVIATRLVVSTADADLK